MAIYLFICSLFTFQYRKLKSPANFLNVTSIITRTCVKFSGLWQNFHVNIRYFVLNLFIFQNFAVFFGKSFQQIQEIWVCSQIMSALIRGVWTPPSPFVSYFQYLAYTPFPLCQRCQHLASPPPQFPHFLEFFITWLDNCFKHLSDIKAQNMFYFKQIGAI